MGSLKNLNTTTMTSEQSNFAMRGCLEGHAGWVTAIATTNENPDMILSASRDKCVMVWALTREDGNYGYPKKSPRGHSHFVQDVVISADGQFALSGSWDGTLRLWNLNLGASDTTFVGHEKDVLSVAFSADNRQIVSGSRDKTIKLWNTRGECKYTIQADGAEGHPSGSPACPSPPTHPTLSSCPAAGTSSSRCGSFPTASFAPTSSGTPATSTPSLSPPTAPSVPPAARTVWPCSGTSTRASASTPSPASRVTSSTLSASPPTGTGSAPPPTWASASGISRARASSMSSSLTSPWLIPSPRRSRLPASPSPGLPTATPSSLGTPMRRSACGRSPLARPPSTKRCCW